ncbi:MAG: hypothetical protein JWR01_1057 [Subtercola sp.]|nr:hypothetical protein [Subtercola sp.]
MSDPTEPRSESDAETGTEATNPPAAPIDPAKLELQQELDSIRALGEDLHG